MTIEATKESERSQDGRVCGMLGVVWCGVGVEWNRVMLCAVEWSDLVWCGV